jgi:hypothetical protein
MRRVLLRSALLFTALTLLMAATVAGGLASPLSAATHPASASKNCSAGYVDAMLSWGEKCLHAGQFCKIGNIEYRAYGFNCPADGRLAASSSTAPATTAKVTPPPTTATQAVQLGKTVLFARRTRSQTCKRGALPDRRCSPGAYSSKLTKAVICSSTFRTGSIRNVPTSEKHAVETEYGMVAKSYGRTIEIDHIVSLELGGSNDIANLYPEPGSGKASYHVKDKLENRLHSMLCAGSITLAAARRGIASNWGVLYKRVFGVMP